MTKCTITDLKMLRAQLSAAGQPTTGTVKEMQERINQLPKKRGRPAGSKNKPKDVTMPADQVKFYQSERRRMKKDQMPEHMQEAELKRRWQMHQKFSQNTTSSTTDDFRRAKMMPDV
eukprot:3040940-Prymnesium_polylepis.2